MLSEKFGEKISEISGAGPTERGSSTIEAEHRAMSLRGEVCTMLLSSISSSSNESVFDGFGYPLPTTIAELILHHCLVDSSCCGIGWTNRSSRRPSARTIESVAALSGTPFAS